MNKQTFGVQPKHKEMECWSDAELSTLQWDKSMHSGMILEQVIYFPGVDEWVLFHMSEVGLTSCSLCPPSMAKSYSRPTSMCTAQLAAQYVLM